jgi:hypothetical protein
MAIFFKRQRQARGEIPDVYQYETLPNALRVQFCLLFQDIFQKPYHEFSEKGMQTRDIAQSTVHCLCREIGRFQLAEDIYSGGMARRFRDFEKELGHFVLQEKDIEFVLSAVEEVYAYIKPDSYLVHELNTRFREHGVGYQLEGGQLIRIDSQYIHQQAVKPALSILSDKSYYGPQKEFLSAHDHFRNGRHQEALVDGLKAFESTIKVICDKRGWEYDKHAAVKKLIAICFENGLVPEFWQSHMNGLRSTLEGCVPTVRNKMGGHGQGADVVNVPDHIAAYTLHMTASTIVFLVKSEQSL